MTVLLSCPEPMPSDRAARVCSTAMIDGLVDAAPKGNCMMAPCNIIASPDLMQRGLQPSVVIDKDGRQLTCTACMHLTYVPWQAVES